MINIESLISEYTSNMYIVNLDDDTYIVDPSVPYNYTKKYIKNLKGIFITHSHFDHIACINDYIKCLNGYVYLNKHGVDIIKDNNKNCANFFSLSFNLDLDALSKFKVIYDGDVIDDRFKVMYTPGHTIDSSCFITCDNIFTGDTIFKDSIGRTDLYSGNSYQMKESIKRFKGFEKNYLIYPGHEEEADLNYIKENNYFLNKK